MGVTVVQTFGYIGSIIEHSPVGARCVAWEQGDCSKEVQKTKKKDPGPEGLI